MAHMIVVKHHHFTVSVVTFRGNGTKRTGEFFDTVCLENDDGQSNWFRLMYAINSWQ